MSSTFSVNVWIEIISRSIMHVITKMTTHLVVCWQLLRPSFLHWGHQWQTMTLGRSRVQNLWWVYHNNTASCGHIVDLSAKKHNILNVKIRWVKIEEKFRGCSEKSEIRVHHINVWKSETFVTAENLISTLSTTVHVRAELIPDEWFVYRLGSILIRQLFNVNFNVINNVN